MEINFQQNNQVSQWRPTTKTKQKKPRTAKSNSGGSSSASLQQAIRYVGVRQRPSGRWVAEIKDTTQKIRMWLGTFETAEAAARAYDEAACLLRGSNTRTNFAITDTHVSNSPLASRIRNLLNHRKQQDHQPHHHRRRHHHHQKKKNNVNVVATSLPPPPPPPPSVPTPVLPLLLPPQPVVGQDLTTSADFFKSFHEMGSMLEMDLSWMYGNGGGLDDGSIPATSSRQVTPLEEIMVPNKTNEVSFTQETYNEHGNSFQNDQEQSSSDQQQLLWESPSFFHLFCQT